MGLGDVDEVEVELGVAQLLDLGVGLVDGRLRLGVDRRPGGGRLLLRLGDPRLDRRGVLGAGVALGILVQEGEMVRDPDSGERLGEEADLDTAEEVVA